MHYYIQKGWDAEKFLKLPSFDKLMYKASMDVALEEKAKFFDRREQNRAIKTSE